MQPPHSSYCHLTSHTTTSLLMQPPHSSYYHLAPHTATSLLILPLCSSCCHLTHHAATSLVITLSPYCRYRCFCHCVCRRCSRGVRTWRLSASGAPHQQKTWPWISRLSKCVFMCGGRTCLPACLPASPPATRHAAVRAPLLPLLPLPAGAPLLRDMC